MGGGCPAEPTGARGTATPRGSEGAPAPGSHQQRLSLNGDSVAGRERCTPCRPASAARRRVRRARAGRAAQRAETAGDRPGSVACPERNQESDCGDVSPSWHVASCCPPHSALQGELGCTYSPWKTPTCRACLCGKTRSKPHVPLFFLFLSVFAHGCAKPLGAVSLDSLADLLYPDAHV